MEIEAFMTRWTSREGGAERANFPMFATEVCDQIGVARPDPSGFERKYNDYVFERAVRRRDCTDAVSSLRIDLYKRGCFIMEAKQSRLPGGYKAMPQRYETLAHASESGQWDMQMRNARQQAENYGHLLDPDHPAPPFIIVCDVGRVFELFADFSGTGRGYSQFPDRKNFRVPIEALRRPEVREMFARIWTDPYSLDPARQTARVTTAIAERLAVVGRSLEKRYPAEEVALFLMRCIFCMFAEDVDLLPKGKFTALLEECGGRSPATLVQMLHDLWGKMDNADHNQRYFSYFCADVRHFNGNLYRNARILELSGEEIGELAAAAKHNWIDVDPAIFGTLLEQALDPTERRKLGAHYTPRAYVERLVERTILDVLRDEWRAVLKKAEDARECADERKALALVQAFHRRLCTTTVLDPACGTGNFLYVALEMMTKLEGEVLETLAGLGGNEVLGLDDETVSPRQFFGLEKNPRAAAIAELVVWIGYLQQHYRTRTGHPKEPILRTLDTINFGRRTGYDAVLAGGCGDGIALAESDAEPRRPEWPEVEFIIGNPPFLGGKDIRARLGDDYAQALWRAHPHVNESADLVMYWWDRAAELLTRKGTKLKRFGFVTTNSISQVFQRRVMERHLNADKPVSILFAIPDHPWTKATKDAASVRIAMTVVEAGTKEGRLSKICAEERLDTDQPLLEQREQLGSINANLSIGANVAAAVKLEANRGLSSRGVVLHGSGFLISPERARQLGLGVRDGLERHIRQYRNGRDVSARARDVLVIDLFGLTSVDVRHRYPEVYQHILGHVKPERDLNPREYRRVNWWLFGENVPDARASLTDLHRYIVTVETAKHRVFQFLDGAILPDNKLICIASDDAYHLSILQSKFHEYWYLANSGMLGVYDREAVYVKSRCFDPFPFPDPSFVLRQHLRSAGEELDALRKRVLDEHADLTLTGLYNVLEKVKAGAALSAREEAVKQRGYVLILKDLHETIDRLTVTAYGWSQDLSDQEVLTRLVALNAERARDEAEGRVRWLRPDYQMPRAKILVAKTQELPLEAIVISIDRGKPVFPRDRHEQPLAVEAVLAASGGALDALAVARLFKGGGARIEPRVAQILLTLARYGHISALPDGRFVMRLVA